MNQALSGSPLLPPLYAMVALTFAVLLVTFLVRVLAVKSGRLRLSYFRVMTGAEPPPVVARTSRHFVNLFEMPVLFYAVTLLALVLNVQDDLLPTLAWVFVGFRALHALVHCTYNDVNHRMTVYFASVIALGTMWVRVAMVTLG